MASISRHRKLCGNRLAMPVLDLQHKSNSKPLVSSVSRGSLIVTGVFLVISSLQMGASAQCGSYVIIGNKAKLRELQANGYLPMNSHQKLKTPKLQSEGAESRKDKISYQSVGNVELEAVEAESPQPCQGPGCRSNPPSESDPGPAAMGIGSLKSGVKPCTKESLGSLENEFGGFHGFDESPLSICQELDRPPE